MPERLRHILRSRVAFKERCEAAKHAQRSCMPGLVHPGAALHQQAGDMPAAVTYGVVERSADRATRRLDIRSCIDQGFGHVDVVAAGRIMQRRLITWTG